MMKFGVMVPFDWDVLYVLQPYTNSLKLIQLFGFHP